jgi:hypothetical protein
MTRPGQRDAFIQIRVTVEQKQQWQALASEWNMPLSDLIRTAVDLVVHPTILKAIRIAAEERGTQHRDSMWWLHR